MNIIKFNYQLYKKLMLEKKQVRIKRHLTKSYHLKLDEAIEMCKQHPRKYYIVQKSEAEYEILGSQEIRKMRKFKEARKDETFMTLHETSPFVSPENLDRLIHEQSRRKKRRWYLFTENRYQPVTKNELEMLRRVATSLGFSDSAYADQMLRFIQKHEG